MGPTSVANHRALALPWLYIAVSSCRTEKNATVWSNKTITDLVMNLAVEDSRWVKLSKGADAWGFFRLERPSRAVAGPRTRSQYQRGRRASVCGAARRRACVLAMQ